MDYNRPNQIYKYFIVLWATVAIPLYLNNKYFNALEAKGYAYLAGAVIGVLLITIYMIKEREWELIVPQRSLIDYAIVAYGLISLVSALLSFDVKASMFGNTGWHVGAIAIAIFSAFYLVLSKDLELNRTIWIIIFSVTAVIYIIGIFHSASIDILGLHAGIYPTQYYWYVSTIGNINWYVGYICLLLPIAVGFFLKEESSIDSVLLGVFIFLGCISSVLCSSDGVYIGIGTFMLVAIPTICGGSRAFERFSLVISMYGIALLGIGTLPVFAAKIADTDQLSATFAQPKIAILVILLGVLGVIIAKVMHNRYSEQLARILSITLESVLVVTIVAVFVKASIEYNNSWGTNRGLIWNYSIALFENFGFKDKMIGVGPEMLRSYFANLSQHTERTVLVAHSQPMQLLLTTGLLGLLAWFAMWAGIAVNAIKNRDNTTAKPYLFALAAYFGQSFINTDQAINTALLCVVISLYSFRMAKENKCARMIKIT